MKVMRRISMPPDQSVRHRMRHLVGCLAMAAVIALAAGCASSSQPAAAQSTSAVAPAAMAESPASTSKLVQTADFATKAEQDGWHSHIQDGEVIYCKTEMPINSRLPTRTCLNKAGVEQMLLAEERQRENMQRAAANAGSKAN